MTRATRESLAHATTCLEQLAYGTDGQTTNPAWTDIVTLLDLFAWLDNEIEAARLAAAYGSGIAEVHILGSSSHGIEARLNDKFLKDLRKLRISWCSQLLALATNLEQQGSQAANWPHRTADTG